VQSSHPLYLVVRNVLLLALLGVAGLALAGPVAAVLAVALSAILVVGAFALVGLLFLGLFQLIAHGPRAAGRSVAGMTRTLVAGLRCDGLRKVVAGLGRFPVVAWQKARLVGELIIVTASGVLVGAGVGLLPVLADQRADEALPVYAISGGMIALIAGIVLSVRERRRTAARAS
jgi:hypothetical protein